MNIQIQQEVSFKVLQVLRSIDDDALIAGGAPRNWLEGRLANDIDCYLRWHGGSCAKMFRTLSKMLGAELEMNTGVECSYSFGGDNFSLTSIFSFTYEDVLFQVMIIGETSPMEFKKDILNHMDIGLNKVGWNPWHLLEINKLQAYIQTNEYKKDVYDSTLTLYQNVMNKDQLKHCMEKHLPKMLSYYPNHTLTIAGGCK